MASVRKRSWKSGDEMKTAWVVDYLDQAGSAASRPLSARRKPTYGW
jgi:hypothetical protein